MGSGAICSSEPPSMLIATTVKCLTFPHDMSNNKKTSGKTLSVSKLVPLTVYSHIGNLFGVRTLTTPLVFLPCWPLFTVTTKLHVMNNFGLVLEPRLGLS